MASHALVHHNVGNLGKLRQLRVVRGNPLVGANALVQRSSCHDGSGQNAAGHQQSGTGSHLALSCYKTIMRTLPLLLFADF